MMDKAQHDLGKRVKKFSPKRIVVKVGTSSLTDATGKISPPLLKEIAGAIELIRKALGAKVSLVSSGAGAAGRAALGLSLPLTMPYKQAAAAVGQSLLMFDWAKAFEESPVAQLLLTADDINNDQRYFNAQNALEAALDLGSIPIINENDSITTSEIKFGDNDTLSAWVAYLMNAELLILLTDIDGLYEADPRKYPEAKRLDVVEDVKQVQHLAGKAGSSRGTGGMVTKLRAAEIASERGIATMIISGGEGARAASQSQL
ncbi:MAG: glutamate 5-kinase [Deinococcales bacterium]